MNETKFTSDGKKVVVIGALNNTQYIVQEIFVTNNGDEVPQGERFVVNALFDTPAKSWKEQKLEELDARYDREHKEWESKIEQMNKEKRKAYEDLTARVNWLKKVAKQPHPDTLKKMITNLALFLSQEDRWVLFYAQCRWHVEPFDKFEQERLGKNRNRDEYPSSIRLLSIDGKDDGTLSLNLAPSYWNTSDGGRDIMLFTSREAALQMAKAKIEECKEYDYCSFRNIAELGLEYDQEKLRKYKEEEREKKLNYIKDAKGYIKEKQISVEKWQKDIEEIDIFLAERQSDNFG